MEFFIFKIKLKIFFIGLRNCLVEENLRLVSYVVSKKFHLESRDDVFQVGVMALIKAIERFNPDKGFQLSSYAYSYIWGEIKKYLLRSENPIKASRKLGRIKVRSLNEMIAESYIELMESIEDPKNQGIDPTEDYLGMLEKRERQLVEMKWIDGLTYNEISELTGLSVNNVTKRIRKSRDFLRSTLIV